MIADLGIAKAVFGEPQVVDGNFLVTYQLIVENTGTVDLADLSLIEDLVAEVGPAFVNAGDLLLVSRPSGPGSSITLNSADFNGRSNTELIDQTADNVLQVGDSFTLLLTVEVDPDRLPGQLINQVDGTATAVDQTGQPLLNSAGQPIIAVDASDGGTDPNSSNPGALGNLGGWSDPTFFNLPTQAGGASGNPPQLPGLPPIRIPNIGSFTSGFLGSAGTIYSGVPINANANPISLDSGRAVSGGFNSIGGMASEDCGCLEPISPNFEGIESDGETVPGEECIMDQPMSVPAEMHNEEMIIEPGVMDGEMEILEGEVQQDWSSEATTEDGEVIEEDGESVIHVAHETIRKPGFLQRFNNWLSR